MNKQLAKYVMTHGREKSRCTIIDINGVGFRVGNVICDNKIYFVVSANSKVVECMEIEAAHQNEKGGAEMTDKKFADEEIKKALECCINDDCDNCPDTFGNCEHNVMRNALALINRQQAEIERLIQDKQYYMTHLDDCERDIIPKLKWSLERANKYGVELEKQISTIRTEAAKEFAESIKAEIIKALESNYKAKSERMAKPNIDMADEFISYCEGKIAVLRGIDDFVDTLISSETKTAETDFPKDYSYGY